MKYYFLFDFYLQSDQGLIDLISESGFESIDPWEDLAEDVDFIVSDFFCHFQLDIVEKIQTKLLSNFVARFLVESCECFDDFILGNKAILQNLRNEGWALYSISGCPFTIASLDEENAKSILYSSRELKKIIKEHIIEF